MCVLLQQHEKYFKGDRSCWLKETAMIIICHHKQANAFLLCLHSLPTLFISLKVYSILLDERHLGIEKCHRANCSQRHGSEGIQLLPNRTNNHWSSLGLFMVSWVKLGNEEHIKRGTTTGGQEKVLRKPMTKAAPHGGSSVMFSTTSWSISPWCTALCADLFITSALYARQQKGWTTVPLVYIRAHRFEQFPTSFEHT